MKVWPGQASLDEQVVRELAAGGARVVENHETWHGLWDRLAPLPERQLDGLSARLALRAACGRVDLGVFARVAATRGFLSAAAGFAGEAERAGLTAAEVARAAALVEEPAVAERLQPLARVLGELQRLGASADRRLGAVLRAPGSFPVAAAVEFMPRLVWEPSDVERVIAVARRARVTVHLPWAAGKPGIYSGIESVLAGFEASGLDDLELVLEEPRVEAAVSVQAAPSPEAELRAVAAWARRLVDGGAAPEELAVAARAPDGRASRLAEELGRVGLLLDDRRGPSLAAAPPARLALSLLTVDRAREPALAVLGSRYLDGGEETHRAARRARELGLREIDPDERLAALPQTATLAGHAAALQALLGTLGFNAWAYDAGGDSRIEAVVARDQAAGTALDKLLARLPAAAEAAGLSAPLTRVAFAAVLADLMAETPLPPRAIRGGAVRLVHLADLAARRFEHIAIIGLVEGAAPARAVDDGVYGDAERRALNRVFDRRVLPSAPMGQRTAFEGVMLENAVAAARRSVLLSHATVVDGRPALRSPFLEEHARLPVKVLGRSPIPPLAEVAAPADLLARLALEAWADPTGRKPLAVAPVLAELPPERVARVAELARIERQRWLAGIGEGDAPVAGPVAAARAGGGPDSPIPARQLELLANCGWSFFAARILGVKPPDEAGDALSPRDAGSLAHRCLEGFYRERARSDELPLRPGVDAAHRRALDAACAAVFADAQAHGHPGLWQIGREQIVDTLWRWVAHEIEHGHPFGGVPAHFELAFGRAGDELPPLRFQGPGCDDVLVSGRIDRVDRLPGGGSLVLDYKWGGKDAQRSKLKENHYLQLPLYVAAAGADDAAFISLKDAAVTRTLKSARSDLADLPAQVIELARSARAGALAARPIDCRGCSYRTVCRVVALAEEHDGVTTGREFLSAHTKEKDI